MRFSLVQNGQLARLRFQQSHSSYRPNFRRHLTSIARKMYRLPVSALPMLRRSGSRTQPVRRPTQEEACVECAGLRFDSRAAVRPPERRSLSVDRQNRDFRQGVDEPSTTPFEICNLTIDGFEALPLHIVDLAAHAIAIAIGGANAHEVPHCHHAGPARIRRQPDPQRSAAMDQTSRGRRLITLMDWLGHPIQTSARCIPRKRGHSYYCLSEVLPR